MATIRFNNIADARGSVNGTVYSRGVGGLYMKTRVKPLNPQTAKQSVVRNQLAALAAAWRSLTEAQRAAWTAQTGNYPATNRVGEVYTPSGYQLYMTLNSNLNAVEEESLDTPLSPSSFVATGLDGFQMELTAGALTTGEISLSIDTGVDEICLVETTGGLSAGVTAPSSSLFKKTTVVSGTTLALDITLDYVALYGQPTVGTKIFAKVYRILSTTGQRQLLGITSTVVSTV